MLVYLQQGKKTDTSENLTINITIGDIDKINYIFNTLIVSKIENNQKGAIFNGQGTFFQRFEE